MNKIIRNHYPVSSLPDDLRKGFDAQVHVRVIVEEEPRHVEDASLSELLQKARQAPPIGDDPVTRIRKLRDEWDD